MSRPFVRKSAKKAQEEVSQAEVTQALIDDLGSLSLARKSGKTRLQEEEQTLIEENNKKKSLRTESLIYNKNREWRAYDAYSPFRFMSGGYGKLCLLIYLNNIKFKIIHPHNETEFTITDKQGDNGMLLYQLLDEIHNQKHHVESVKKIETRYDGSFYSYEYIVYSTIDCEKLIYDMNFFETDWNQMFESDKKCLRTKS